MLHHSRRTDLSCAVLAVGGVIYALLCWPAISNRGYQFVDLAWLGAAQLWFVPVALSAIFDDLGNRRRKWHLTAYALATAFINSATLHNLIPFSNNVLFMFVTTLIGYGPLHLLGTFLTEWIMQAILRRTLTDPPQETAAGLPQFSLGLWFVVFSLLCVTVGFPFAFRSFVLGLVHQQAQARADRDWQNQSVGIFGKFSYEDDGLRVQVGRESQMQDRGYHRVYNQRIAEHIRHEGLPSYFGKGIGAIRQTKTFQSWLDDPKFEKVTSFPYVVSRAVTVLQDGSVEHIETEVNGYNAMGPIIAVNTRNLGSGTSLPVYVRRVDRFIAVRHGNEWLGLFTEDGFHVGTVTRAK